MSTTSVRLPPELKARVARLAAQTGVTAHGFILEAVEDRVNQAEARAAFIAEARDRLAEMETTGMAVAWDEARQYLLDRALGKPAVRPSARRLVPAAPPPAKTTRKRSA